MFKTIYSEALPGQPPSNKTVARPEKSELLVSDEVPSEPIT